MRLSSLEIRTRALPASGPLPARVAIVVRAEADGDAAGAGLGEGTAMPGHSPDPVLSFEALSAELAPIAASLPPRLGDLPLGDAGRALGPALGEALGEALGGAPGPLVRFPALAFALESALLDLAGRRVGRAASALFEGALCAPVPVNALLRADAPDLEARGVAAAAAGYACLKIKLRARDEAGFSRELARLEALRRALGPAFELRLDANAAWGLDEARRRLDALARVAPSFVEQPVAAADLVRLGQAAVPFAADESLADASLWPALLEAPGCAAFVLKPAVLGGLARSLDLARRAAARGLGVVVTHLFDGPIALASACELALAMPEAPLASGLDLHAGLEAWPHASVPQRREPFWVLPAEAPGLGMDTEDRRALLSGSPASSGSEPPGGAGQGRDA